MPGSWLHITQGEWAEHLPLSLGSQTECLAVCATVTFIKSFTDDFVSLCLTCRWIAIVAVCAFYRPNLIKGVIHPKKIDSVIFSSSRRSKPTRHSIIFQTANEDIFYETWEICLPPLNVHAWNQNVDSLKVLKNIVNVIPCALYPCMWIKA